jgi:hypothetical protein
VYIILFTNLIAARSAALPATHVESIAIAGTDGTAAPAPTVAQVAVAEAVVSSAL